MEKSKMQIYYEENKDHIKELVKKKYDENKEEIKIKHKKYYEDHKEYFKKYKKEYKKTYIPKIKICEICGLAYKNGIKAHEKLQIHKMSVDLNKGIIHQSIIINKKE